MELKVVVLFGHKLALMWHHSAFLELLHIRLAFQRSTTALETHHSDHHLSIYSHWVYMLGR
jgi:hypothetical protein